MSDPYNHDACLKSYRALEAERDALKAELQIKENLSCQWYEAHNALKAELETSRQLCDEIRKAEYRYHAALEKIVEEDNYDVPTCLTLVKEIAAQALEGK